MAYSIFMDIDYDEGVPGTYRAVEVTVPFADATLAKRFETGDPVKDFFDAAVYSVEMEEKIGRPVMMLSSTTHFTMDDPAYCWGDNGLLKSSAANEA